MATYRHCLILIYCLAIAGGRACACDTGTVRDAGFHGRRDIFRLTVFSPAGDAGGDAVYRGVEEALRGKDGVLNVVPVRVATDGSTRWEEYGFAEAPLRFPVTTLTTEVQGLDRLLFVDEWVDGPGAADLASLVDSPLRRCLTEEVLRVWAVLLYSPGPNPEPGRSALFERVKQRWAVEQSPGVSVVTLDRNDAGERTLRAFAGLEKNMPDWVGIVYGKCRLLLPPLLGDALTEEALDAQLKRLAVQCTCTEDASVHSVSVPVSWPASLDKRVPVFVPRAISRAVVAEARPREGVLRVYVLGAILAVGSVVVLATGIVVWRGRR